MEDSGKYRGKKLQCFPCVVYMCSRKYIHSFIIIRMEWKEIQVGWYFRLQESEMDHLYVFLIFISFLGCWFCYLELCCILLWFG